MKEHFKKITGTTYRDILWELERLCPCGSGVEFEYCCASGESRSFESDLENKRELEFENN